MDSLEAWLGLFYSDPEYLPFQEAFDKVPDKKFIGKVVTGCCIRWLGSAGQK